MLDPHAGGLGPTAARQRNHVEYVPPDGRDGGLATLGQRISGQKQPGYLGRGGCTVALQRSGSGPAASQRVEREMADLDHPGHHGASDGLGLHALRGGQLLKVDLEIPPAGGLGR